MSKQSRLNKEKAQKAKASQGGSKSTEGSQKGGASPSQKRNENAADAKGEKQ